MEENIFEMILQNIELEAQIPLSRPNHFNTYLGESMTRIQGKMKNAIHYRISQNNSKRITSRFIELTYQYLMENNIYPNRNWYLNHEELGFEFASRQCNKSVAKGLIEMVL